MLSPPKLAFPTAGAANSINDRGWAGKTASDITASTHVKSLDFMRFSY
jgi:hypothetical protein